MNNNKLILHAVIMHKPFFKTKEQAITKAHEMFHQNVSHSEVRTHTLYELFPNEATKTFVRETPESFRVRIKPKQQFINTSFVSKVINPNITLVFGYLKN